MTPFSDSSRTATISLTQQQEEIVRRGFNKDSPFEEAVAQMILEKLHASLRSQDVLLGPVGSNTKRPQVKLLDL